MTTSTIGNLAQGSGFTPLHGKPRPSGRGGRAQLSRMNMTLRPRLLGRGAGFTLVEVLVSVAILAVGAPLIMHALARASYAHAVAEHHAQAYLFAASKLSEIELAARETRELKDHYEEGSFRIGNQAFEWQVVATPAADDQDLASVLLTLSWRHGADVYERRFETLLRLPPEEPS